MPRPPPPRWSRNCRRKRGCSDVEPCLGRPATSRGSAPAHLLGSRRRRAEAGGGARRQGRGRAARLGRRAGRRGRGEARPRRRPRGGPRRPARLYAGLLHRRPGARHPLGCARLRGLPPHLSDGRLHAPPGPDCGRRPAAGGHRLRVEGRRPALDPSRDGRQAPVAGAGQGRGHGAGLRAVRLLPGRRCGPRRVRGQAAGSRPHGRPAGPRDPRLRGGGRRHCRPHQGGRDRGRGPRRRRRGQDGPGRGPGPRPRSRDRGQPAGDRQRLAPPRPPDRLLGPDGGPQAVRGGRHLRRHPAPGRHEGLLGDRGDQQGPRRADLHRRPLRHRRRPPRGAAGPDRSDPGRQRLVAPPWVVLKFGGTSVSTPERWTTIAGLARQRIDEGLRPLVVCSAVSGISNQLEALLALAVEDRHLELGAGLGIDAALLLRADFEELSRLALAASLLREAGPALKARVMAFGELMSTRLGAAFLESQGIETAWLDARTALAAREDPIAHGPRAYLSATCSFERDEELSARLAALPGAALVTQGFIARNREGQTVLLGRGGSDTSAAYFAARLGAAQCEIWTDVPGLFTANPALIPSARLLRALHYDEAQEIATLGAKVLHPRTVPPLRAHGIPLHVLSTDRPDVSGTVISAAGPVSGPQVKAISSRPGLTLVSMETVGMWQEVGFLARIFEVFARHGLSVDSVSTSETNVTVSLDPQANALDPEGIALLLSDLGAFCEPHVIAPTASVSLVGRGIRAILHELGPVLEAFEELKIHLVTQAASDLNLTFVVDEDQSERLVRQLHGLLFGQKAESALFGPTWSELFDEPGEDSVAYSPEWWRDRRAKLLEIAAERGPVYAYDAGTLRAAAESLRALDAVDRVFYSVKANCHPEVLRVFHEAGLGFECVSAAELVHVRALFPGLDGSRLLFTPNFAPRDEYRQGFEMGTCVTLDNLHPLREWPELFRGREVFLRLDPGR